MKKLLSLFSILFLLCSPCNAQWWFNQKPYLGTQIEKGNSLSKGLVGCWMMNEGSGNKIYDLSGNQNNYSTENCIWRNGSDGPELYLPNPYYIEGLFKGPTTGLTMLLKTNNGFSLDYCRIITLDKNSDSSWEHGIQIWAGNLEAAINAAGGGLGDITLSYNLAAIRHLAVTYNGNVQILYVNGLNAGSSTSKTGLLTATSRLQIGKLSQYIISNFDITQVLIYNRALSAAEIAQLYREPFCMFEQYPIMYVPIVTPSGQVIYVIME